MKVTCCSRLKDLDAVKISVDGFKNSCFFCRKCGEKFSLEELIPWGVCPDLFFQIYPSYLSAFYGGKDTDGAVLSCPGKTGKTYWRLRSRKLFLSPLINLAGWIFRLLGKPKDLFDSYIEIEMIETKGDCPRGYVKGQKFYFNQYSHIWGHRFFCPAVFYTLYPFLVNYVPGSPVLVQCPADYTSIIFKIDRA